MHRNKKSWRYAKFKILSISKIVSNFKISSPSRGNTWINTWINNLGCYVPYDNSSFVDFLVPYLIISLIIQPFSFKVKQVYFKEIVLNKKNKVLKYSNTPLIHRTLSWICKHLRTKCRYRWRTGNQTSRTCQWIAFILVRRDMPWPPTLSGIICWSQWLIKLTAGPKNLLILNVRRLTDHIWPHWEIVPENKLD